MTTFNFKAHKTPEELAKPLIKKRKKRLITKNRAERDEEEHAAAVQNLACLGILNPDGSPKRW